MKTTRAGVMVLAVLALALGLAACKSSRSCSSGNCAPPVASTEQAPAFVDVGPTYPPSAPSYNDSVAVAPPSVSKAEFDAVVDRADDAKRKADELASRLAEERRERERQDARLRDMEGRIDDLTRPPAGQLPPQPDASALEVQPIEKLADELRARSQADVRREGDMVVVCVADSFKAGSDLLKSDVQLISTLNATADALTRFPGATVAVVGHTDGDPIKKSGWESNDALSLARAQRVAQVLADNGVERNRISIDGQGFRSPLVPHEASRADKARNRRVEIMIRM